jgi:hypothetical protein
VGDDQLQGDERDSETQVRGDDREHADPAEPLEAFRTGPALSVGDKRTSLPDLSFLIAYR